MVLGAVFTFLAIAYSTTRAATQSRALVGKKKYGAVSLGEGHDEGHEVGVVNVQPGRTETPKYQALLAAVEAGYATHGVSASENVTDCGIEPSRPQL